MKNGINKSMGKEENLQNLHYKWISKRMKIRIQLQNTLTKSAILKKQFYSATLKLKQNKSLIKLIYSAKIQIHK